VCLGIPGKVVETFREHGILMGKVDFGGVSKRPFGKEFVEFSQFTQRMLARIPNHSKVFDAPQAVGPLKYRDTAAIDGEIARYQRLSAPMKSRFSELFMNAPSPGIIATTMLNAHYPSHQDYLDAIAREMQIEYRRVVDAGFVLQIDAPDLAMERVLLYQDASDAEFANSAAAVTGLSKTANRLRTRPPRPAHREPP